MKRIRLYAMILGLLACAAVANAQQQLAIPGLSNAQVLAIASGNKLVQLPPTDQNGALNLTALGLDKIANNVNKTITVLVEQCGNKPPLVYVLLPGQTPPEPEKDCRRWKLGAYVPDGSGNWRQVEGPESGAPYAVQITGTPAAPPTPIGEGPSFFNPKAHFGVGFWDALDLPHECVGLTGCSTSNKAFAFEGGFALGFGPVDLLLGAFKTNDVSINATETFGSDGETSTETATEKWHFNAFEYGVRPNLLGFKLGGRRLTVGPQGGGWVWTIKGKDSFCTSSGGSCVGTTENFSFGGHAGWWGGHAEWSLCHRLAATFDYKHSDLHYHSFTQNLNYFGFGLSWSVQNPRSFFTFGD